MVSKKSKKGVYVQHREYSFSVLDAKGFQGCSYWRGRTMADGENKIVKKNPKNIVHY